MSFSGLSTAWVHRKHSNLSPTMAVSTTPGFNKMNIADPELLCPGPLQEPEFIISSPRLKNATCKDSDVWTLRTKTVIYRDKYHLIVGIRAENESQSDFLQPTFVPIF